MASQTQSPFARQPWLAAAVGAGVGVASVLLLLRVQRGRSAAAARAEIARLAAPPSRSEIIVLGSGSSTGVPRAACVTDPNSKCNTCRLAMIGPSELNRNWRANPSLLIRVVRPPTAAAAAEAKQAGTVAGNSVHNIVIDVGKTFLSTALRLYPRFGVRSLDSVVITHEHADAVLGMDDIRSMQRFEQLEDGSMQRLNVHVGLRTLQSMRTKFDYLCDDHAVKATLAHAGLADPAPPLPAHTAAHGAPATAIVERKVAQLDWKLILPFVPFTTCDLRVLPLPVLHGEDYVSFGFLLGGDGEHQDAVLYISDVSRIPESTWHFLCTGQLPTPPPHCTTPEQRTAFFATFNDVHTHPLPKEQTQWSIMPSTPLHPIHSSAASAASPSSSSSPAAPPSCAPRISLLIVDALFPSIGHNTHFHLPQALEFIERLQPRRALITGMSDLFEYERDNACLIQRRQAGELTVDVQLAYDGLRMPLDL